MIFNFTKYSEDGGGAEDGEDGKEMSAADRKIYKKIRVWQAKREAATSQWNMKSTELTRLTKGRSAAMKQIKDLERHIAEYSAELQYLQDQRNK